MDRIGAAKAGTTLIKLADAVAKHAAEWNSDDLVQPAIEARWFPAMDGKTVVSAPWVSASGSATFG